MSPEDGRPRAAIDAAWALTAALRAAWGPDTCAPEDRADWTSENPSRGQCITTVLIVHDVFGGDLVRGEVHVSGQHVDYHWWNRLPDGSEVDLTGDQFAEYEVVVGQVRVDRPGGWTRTHEQYAILKARVARATGTLVSRPGPTDQ